MLLVTVTPIAEKELKKLKNRRDWYKSVCHHWDHVFWQRLADYTQIDPRWLYRRGIKYRYPHGRQGGVAPPLSIPELVVELITPGNKDRHGLRDDLPLFTAIGWVEGDYCGL